MLKFVLLNDTTTAHWLNHRLLNVKHLVILVQTFGNFVTCSFRANPLNFPQSAKDVLYALSPKGARCSKGSFICTIPKGSKMKQGIFYMHYPPKGARCSKGFFICCPQRKRDVARDLLYAPSQTVWHIPLPLLHQLWSTGWDKK